MTKITIYNVQRAITLKTRKPHFWFLCSVRCFTVVNISIKFRKISRTVFRLWGGHDFLTDRQIDREGRKNRRTDANGKRNVSPDPEGVVERDSNNNNNNNNKNNNNNNNNIIIIIIILKTVCMEYDFFYYLYKE